MTDKEKVISNVYNEFYGSINNTLKDAQKIDPSIKYQDVKQWFDKSFTRKTNLKGFNSFIANYPFQEFQMDLFFINDLENQEFTTGLLAIDIFTKFITVVPLKSKLADDVLTGIKEALALWVNHQMFYILMMKVHFIQSKQNNFMKKNQYNI